MKHMIGIGARAALLGIFAAAFGCTQAVDTGVGGPNGFEEEIGVEQDAIINGTTVNPEYSGFVKLTLSNGEQCSGTLLTNRTVLTARHCVELDAANPNGLRILMGTQAARGLAIAMHPSMFTRDTAVVQMNQAFWMRNGAVVTLKRGGYTMALSTSTATGNRSLECYGYGRFVRNSFTGLGVLRKATLTGAMGPAQVTTFVNGSDQIQAEGDSGGSCFTFTGSPPFRTPILESVTGNCLPSGASPTSCANDAAAGISAFVTPLLRNCSHDVCRPGTALPSTCDPCAASICAIDPFCCNNEWDGQCVGEATSICGASTCSVNCGHDLCTTGALVVPGCDSCVTQICQSDPFCCNNSWDNVCVGELTSICGRSCE